MNMITRKKILNGLLLSSVALLMLPSAATADGPEVKLRRMGKTNTLKFEELRALPRNKLLTVQATMRNTAKRDVNFNYRFKWLDDIGMKVADDEMWNPMTAYAGQIFELTGVAPTSKATDFVIEIEGF
jgi:hypothetical protein